MSIQFQKVALGVLSAALLAGTAGCGSDSKGGSGGEVGRIAASLQDRQAELSTESLDGVWFGFREDKYKSSASYEGDGYSYKGTESYRFYVVMSDNGDYVEVDGCHDIDTDINMTSGTVTIDGIDFSDISVSDNLKMEMSIDIDESGVEEGVKYSFVVSSDVTLFKISDDNEYPIGLGVVDGVEGGVNCVNHYRDEWSGKGSYNSTDWSGKGVYEEFDVRGDQAISLVKDDWEYSDEGEYLEYSVEVNGEYGTEEYGASYALDIESPLLYSLDMILDDTTPTIEGQIAIH